MSPPIRSTAAHRLAGLAAVASVALLGWLTARNLNRRIERLNEAFRRRAPEAIAALSTDEAARDEIGELARHSADALAQTARLAQAHRDTADQVVAIEVKRRGEIDGVEQLTRYIERLHLDSSLGQVRGVFVAQQVKPQARVLAEARGYRVVEVDYDELRGMRPDELRLF